MYNKQSVKYNKNLKLSIMKKGIFEPIFINLHFKNKVVSCGTIYMAPMQDKQSVSEFLATVFTRFVARALIFFNLTHCRAPIQTGVYLSTGACYFQSKITTKIIGEGKYFTTFNLSPYDLIIT